MGRGKRQRSGLPVLQNGEASGRMGGSAPPVERSEEVDEAEEAVLEMLEEEERAEEEEYEISDDDDDDEEEEEEDEEEEDEDEWVEHESEEEDNAGEELPAVADDDEEIEFDFSKWEGDGQADEAVEQDKPQYLGYRELYGKQKGSDDEDNAEAYDEDSSSEGEVDIDTINTVGNVPMEVCLPFIRLSFLIVCLFCSQVSFYSSLLATDLNFGFSSVLQWYDDYEHIGYNLKGQKIMKSTEGRDALDRFLEREENPSAHWRTVFDKKNQVSFALLISTKCSALLFSGTPFLADASDW